MKLIIRTMLIMLLLSNTELPKNMEKPIINDINTRQHEVVVEQPYIDFSKESTEKVVWKNPCSQNSTFKSYMDYRAITNVESEQWKLQQHAHTDELGQRVFNDRVMVAMANQEVGDELEIIFDDGQELSVIVGDIKAGTSCAHSDGSIIEFIVDTDKIPTEIKIHGSFNVLYEGVINKIGRRVL